MKKLILFSILLLTGIAIFAQSIDVGTVENTTTIDSKNIRNVINNADGSFYLIDSEDELKLWIKDSGEVDWFLDGASMSIRDSKLEAFPELEPGVNYRYDFLRINGETGRIGFNLLDGRSDYSGGQKDSLTSSIHLLGSIATRVRTQQAGAENDYDVAQDDHTIIVKILTEGDGDKTLQLPSAIDCKGREYIIKREAETDKQQKVTLVPVTGEKIDGQDEFLIDAEFGVATIVSDGVQWWITSANKKIEAISIISNATLEKEEVAAVDFSSTNQSITITLPPAADRENQRYEIKRNSNGLIPTGCVLYVVPSLVGGVSEKLDQYDATTKYTMLNDWEAVTVQSTGTRWLILGNYGH